MKILIKLRNAFLKFFGDIKVYKYPFFLLYDPGSYKVKGSEIRKVIENIQKGDILVRGYSNYLDGYFIPGFFSHAGLYLGETHETDLYNLENNKDKFYCGKQVVIHSMAEGVFMEDLINFCKCDYLIILRRNKEVEPDFDIDKSFEKVRENALNNLGKSYDFAFNFENTDSVSCTEFVYNCNADFINNYNVKLKLKKVFFKQRTMLIPDDIVTNKFSIAFVSDSVKKDRLEKILRNNDN